MYQTNWPLICKQMKKMSHEREIRIIPAFLFRFRPLTVWAGGKASGDMCKVSSNRLKKDEAT